MMALIPLASSSAHMPTNAIVIQNAEREKLKSTTNPASADKTEANRAIRGRHEKKTYCSVGLRLSALAGLVVLFSFSRSAFWMTMAFVGICALLLARGMSAIMRLSLEALVLSRSLNTHFIETLNGLRSVRSLSAEKFVVDNYRNQIRHYVRMLFKIDALNQGYKAVPAPHSRPDRRHLAVAESVCNRVCIAGVLFRVDHHAIRILTSLGAFVLAGGDWLLMCGHRRMRLSCSVSH